MDLVSVLYVRVVLSDHLMGEWNVSNIVSVDSINCDVSPSHDRALYQGNEIFSY